MYFLYLDDSGSAANPNEDYFVLGGVCINENSTYWLQTQLENYASKIDPNNPDGIEFHASDILQGAKQPWKSYTKRKDRIDIIRNVLFSLKGAKPDTVLFSCAVHKDSFPKDDPVEKAFEDLISRFDMYLGRRYHATGDSHRGLIIFDESSHETSLQKLTAEFRVQGTRWGGLNNIAEVPLFVNSKATRLIQLADHIAYAVFRRYNAMDLAFFNCIEDRFDEDQSVIHGLCHLQKVNPNCSCPACITRKSP
jgi:hypothetical protein